ncbi:MAG: pyrroline-5-carboxylate reductase, partial [Candidatus Dormibacteraceae bacterium]
MNPKNLRLPLGSDDTMGIIGAGVMGKSLARRLLAEGIVTPDQLWASAKSAATCKRVSQELGISVETNYQDRVPSTRLVVLCVKPVQIAGVAAYLRQAGLPPEALVISIAAGITTQQLGELLETANPSVRAMPNTPCIVGEGTTVVCGGPHAGLEQIELARRIFEAVGHCEIVDEGYFNAITALSGSGPAYAYLIIEALADAGVRVGLPRDLALRLISQTMLGATRMVQESGCHPAALRD